MGAIKTEIKITLDHKDVACIVGAITCYLEHTGKIKGLDSEPVQRMKLILNRLGGALKPTENLNDV